ncbi:MAG: GNAT family N-acetyltransferase [Candidatus Hodarchaeales archaeon]
MNLSFKIAAEKDIPELTEIMTRTFDDDSQEFLGEPKGGPDGYDNGEFFQRWMIEEEASTGYKILLNDKVIGAFIVFIYESRKNVLGTMFIDPEYQNMGVGTRTWQFIEITYPDANWALDTPSWATRNHHFYTKKCGFKKVREQEVDDFPGKLFIYQK